MSFLKLNILLRVCLGSPRFSRGRPDTADVICFVEFYNAIFSLEQTRERFRFAAFADAPRAVDVSAAYRRLNSLLKRSDPPLGVVDTM